MIDGVIRMFVDMAKYSPLRGSSYLPLPRYLQLKKAIINVKSDDDDDEHCLK